MQVRRRLWTKMAASSPADAAPPAAAAQPTPLPATFLPNKCLISMPPSQSMKLQQALKFAERVINVVGAHIRQEIAQRQPQQAKQKHATSSHKISTLSKHSLAGGGGPGGSLD